MKTAKEVICDVLFFSEPAVKHAKLADDMIAALEAEGYRIEPMPVILALPPEYLARLQEEWDETSAILEAIGAGPLPGASEKPQDGSTDQ